MDTSQFEDVRVGEGSILARVLLVAGRVGGVRCPGVADVGYGERSRIVLAGPSGSARSAVRGRETAAGALEQARPITNLVEPVLAPVVRPVVSAVAPVLSVVRPVTEPVLRPVLDAVAPVVHAGTTRLRDDVRPAPAEQPAAATTGQPEAEAVVSGRQPRADRPAFAEPTTKDVGVPAGLARAARMSGPDGGGSTPPAPEGPAASGTMAAGPAGQHGGEYAVTGSGWSMPGPDRAWRAPPGGCAPLYWLVFYGNDHPS